MSRKKKNNRYVAIDFEKLDTLPSSVCSVGVAVIENNQITDNYFPILKKSLKNNPPKSQNINNMKFIIVYKHMVYIIKMLKMHRNFHKYGKKSIK